MSDSLLPPSEKKFRTTSASEPHQIVREYIKASEQLLIQNGLSVLRQAPTAGYDGSDDADAAGLEGRKSALGCVIGRLRARHRRIGSGARREKGRRS